jgi:hypothetical protein
MPHYPNKHIPCQVCNSLILLVFRILGTSGNNAIIAYHRSGKERNILKIMNNPAIDRKDSHHAIMARFLKRFVAISRFIRVTVTAPKSHFLKPLKIHDFRNPVSEKQDTLLTGITTSPRSWGPIQENNPPARRFTPKNKETKQTYSHSISTPIRACN